MKIRLIIFLIGFSLFGYSQKKQAVKSGNIKPKAEFVADLMSKMTIEEKIEAIAKKIYRADGIQLAPQAKKQLEQLIHQPVESFAYPFGIYSQRDADFAKQAGYKTAVTTKEGIDIVNCDFFQLQRIKISGKDSIRTVKHRLEYGVK